MQNNLEVAFAFVKKDEGGYTNDPEDPGGPTNFGITLATLTQYRGKTTTAKDVQRLKESEAVGIYNKLYWKPNNCDQLPGGVDYFTFDCAILHGQVTAARWLQLAAKVKADGEVGPKTLEAVRCTDAKEIIKTMEDLRRRRCKSSSKWPRYGRGWTNRINRAVARAVELVEKTPDASV